jgi:Fe2+ or Zn2+ uptake regulation protein
MNYCPHCHRLFGDTQFVGFVLRKQILKALDESDNALSHERLYQIVSDSFEEPIVVQRFNNALNGLLRIDEVYRGTDDNDNVLYGLEKHIRA